MGGGCSAERRPAPALEDLAWAQPRVAAGQVAPQAAADSPVADDHVLLEFPALLDQARRVTAASAATPRLRSTLAEPAADVAPGPVANAGNSCYLSAVVSALFATTCRLDSLLTWVDAPRDSEQLQRHLLQRVVNPLRLGQPVTADAMEAARELCRRLGWERGAGGGAGARGWQARQQDASEFAQFLMEHLGWSGFAWVRSRLHGGVPEPADVQREASSVLLLDMPAPGAPHELGALLAGFFGGDRDDVTHVVRALWPAAGGPDPRRKAVASLQTYALSTVPTVVPVVLKRFTGARRKDSRLVDVPRAVAVAQFLDGDARGAHAACALRLQSAVLHAGARLDSGHYVAVTRALDGSDDWFLMDDLAGADAVRRLPFAAVRERVAAEGYLLLFEVLWDARVCGECAALEPHACAGRPPPLPAQRAAADGLPCEFCAELVPEALLQQHQAVCALGGSGGGGGLGGGDEAPIPCEACGRAVPFRELEQHLLACAGVAGGDGGGGDRCDECGVLVVAGGLAEHARRAHGVQHVRAVLPAWAGGGGQMVIQACPYCGFALREEDLRAHALECQLRPAREDPEPVLRAECGREAPPAPAPRHALPVEFQNLG